MQKPTNTLLNEVQNHIDRLAELAVTIREQGLASEAADLLIAETPADQSNGTVLEAATAVDQTLVDELDVQAFIHCDLRDSFAATLLTPGL